MALRSFSRSLNLSRLSSSHSSRPLVSSAPFSSSSLLSSSLSSRSLSSFHHRSSSSLCSQCSCVACSSSLNRFQQRSFFSNEANTSSPSSSSSSPSSSQQSQPSSSASSSSSSSSPPPPPPSAADVDALRKELSESQAKARDVHEKYVRTLAEMENVRTRLRREADDSKKYAITSFAKSLLEVADTMELAMKSVEDTLNKEREAKGPEDPSVKMMASLLDGVKMIEKVLLQIFERNNVVKFTPLGDKFDPNLHMCLYQVEAEGKEPNTVHTVMKSGYKVGDRVLRAAQVGTVKAAAAKQAE